MAALRSWLLTNGSAPLCLCKPFSCRACPGQFLGIPWMNVVLGTTQAISIIQICRTQNPHIPRAGRGGAAHSGVAGRGGAVWDADGSVCPERTVPFALQDMEETCTNYKGTQRAVDPRFMCIRGLSAGRRPLFNSWLLTNVPTPTCLCKPFSCKAYPGICYQLTTSAKMRLTR